MKTSFKFLSLAIAICLPMMMSAQGRLFSRSANVNLDATNKSSPEDIKAKTNSGNLVIDIASSRVEASVLIKSFLFEKALMQEHFNENYMESTKFPKATFKGKIDDASKVDFNKDGTYTVNLSGDLSIHGISKAVTTPAVFTVKSGVISSMTNFRVNLKDYGISIPSLVADKLAGEAKVIFGAELAKM